MHEKLTLPNGVRIVYEHIPHVRSVSMGIWIGTGSRFESAKESGASHFIEHMLFKGTHSRTAADIASQSDEIGGLINAFTSKECTCFHGRVLDIHLEKLTDILCDMFFNSKFDETDVENERGVIFEEIDMYEDAPDDLVSERLFSSVFKGNPIARPVLGTKRTLSSFTGKMLREYMLNHYDANAVVISLSGNFSPKDIEKLVGIFSALQSKGRNKLNSAIYKPAFVTKKKNIEQNHLCIGFPGLGNTSDDRFAFQLMSTILGGSMSSRLFQTVREQNGLCYSICSYNASYAREGLFSVYAALSRETEDRALELIKSELVKFSQYGATPEELISTKQQCISNILMGLESTGSRMNRLGRGELASGNVMDIDELCARYEAVTTDDIKRLAESQLDFNSISFSAVGKTKNVEHYMEILKG